MFNFILKVVANSFDLASEYLESQDTNANGWDDAAARVLDLSGGIIKDYLDNTIGKKTLLSAVEIAEVIAENLDDNNSGVDDSIAEWLKNIREKIDLLK